MPVKSERKEFAPVDANSCHKELTLLKGAHPSGKKTDVTKNVIWSVSIHIKFI